MLHTCCSALSIPRANRTALACAGTLDLYACAVSNLGHDSCGPGPASSARILPFRLENGLKLDFRGHGARYTILSFDIQCCRRQT